MFVSVAVPVPTLPLLTYRVPASAKGPVRGARVLVPLGTRTMTGLIVSTDVPAVDGEVKDLIEVLDAEAFLRDAIIELAL
jgi:primosomal protein N'